MEFSNQQKLIVALLTEIHARLNIEDGLDPEFIQRTVNGGQGWALTWKYPGLFEEAEEDPQTVKFVADVLEMWSALETSFNALDETGRESLQSVAGPFGTRVEFPGFDGNNETEHLSIARIFVEDLDRWSEFQGRIRNAHMRTVDGYERMLEVFEEIRTEKMNNGDYGALDAEELGRILTERTHPSYR
ncbi:YfbU family protein [Pseudomonas putida]|nr:YfbU family protein [Pseudomonas putida]